MTDIFAIKYLKLISLSLIGVWQLTIAQKVVPLKVVVERGIPGESFSKTSLGLEFWVQEQAQVITVNEHGSSVLELTTDTGESLLEAHRKAVADRKKYVEEQAKKGRYMFSSRSEKLIDFDNSRSFRDTLGFKLVIDSWAIPSKPTSSLKSKIKISYFIEDVGTKEQISISKDVVLTKAKQLIINDKQVTLDQNGYSTSNGEKFLYFQLSTSELGELVEKVEMVNEESEVIEVVSSSKANEKVRFTISEKHVNSPIHLKFTIKPLQKKSVILEQKVTIGL